MNQRLRANSKSKNKSSMTRTKSLLALPGWFLLAVSFIAMILLVSSIMWQMQSTLMLAANANTSSISKSNFRSVPSGTSLLPGNSDGRKTRDPTSLDSEYALTPDQLDALLRRQDQPSVVAYFAPWCGHCQHFIPKYIKFADQHQHSVISSSSSFKSLSLEEQEQGGHGQNPAVFGTVDCVAQRDLCDRQSIKGYPTLLIRNVADDKATIQQPGPGLGSGTKSIPNTKPIKTPSKPSSMEIRGVELIGDLSKLEKYLSNHHLLVDASPSSALNTPNKSSNKDSLSSYTPQREKGQLQQWMEMTQYGLGRYDRLVSPYAPLLRLTDALMSLNYLIATETFHRQNPPATTASTTSTAKTTTSTDVDSHVSNPPHPMTLTHPQATALVSVIDLLVQLLPTTATTATSTTASSSLSSVRTAYHHLHSTLQFLSTAPEPGRDTTASVISLSSKEVMTIMDAVDKATMKVKQWRNVAIEEIKQHALAPGGRRLVQGPKPAPVKGFGVGKEGNEEEGKVQSSSNADHSLDNDKDQPTGLDKDKDKDNNQGKWAKENEEDRQVTWRLCGVLSPSTSFSSSSNRVMTGAISTQGYTCGLWSLLHFFTVASGQQQGQGLAAVSTSSSNTTTTTTTTTTTIATTTVIMTVDVMGVIRALIDQLFACSECRSNFLTTFDSCQYGRCKIGRDFEAMQYWLFQVHNGVTLRIFDEIQETSSPSTTTGTQRGKKTTASVNTTVDQILYMLGYMPKTSSSSSTRSSSSSASRLSLVALHYPSTSECPLCRFSSSKNTTANSIAVVWDKKEVVRYLQQAYWMPDVWFLQQQQQQSQQQQQKQQ